MQLKQFQVGGLLILALGLSACGDNNSTPSAAPSPVQGRVTQGPVSGATIFADRIAGGTPFVLDIGVEVNANTGTTGNFSMSVPAGYGDYVLVSQGGTDILTNKPAMQMMAPAGSANVTPLTTLVALAPAGQQAAMKTLIQATGVSFDADISTNATPAALFLAKSIESAIATLSTGINQAQAGNPLTGAQMNDVQQKAMSKISARLSSEPNLQTASLQDGISKGITDVMQPGVLANDGISVNSADIPTIAAAVSNMVATVATGMGNATGTFATTGTSTEAAVFTTAFQGSVNAAITTNATMMDNTSLITHPTVVLKNSSLTGIAINSPVTLVFSRTMNPATINSTTFSVSGVTGAVTYNSATKTATFTPAAALSYDTLYTVTLTAGITDTAGITLIPATLTFRTVPRPITGSTGSSGTGANF